jgi:hypothetical protein
MRTLDARTILLALVILLTTMAPVPGSLDAIRADAGTRAEGEDITVLFNLSFSGPLDYRVSVHMEVYGLYYGDDLHNASSLRSLVEDGGSSARVDLASELMDRSMALLLLSFGGDALVEIAYGLPEEGLSLSGDQGRPVLFDGTINGKVDIARFISATEVGDVPKERYDELVCAFLLSGFRFQRMLTLRSETGITATYVLPTRISPYTDGAVTLNVRNTRVPPVAETNPLTIDGRLGILTGPFDLQMTGYPPIRPDSEDLTGTTLIDWTSLEELGIGSDIEVRSVSMDDLGISDIIPSSVSAPEYVGSGLVRLCFLDGLLDEDDRSEMESFVGSEIRASYEAAVGVEEFDLITTVDTAIGSIDRPSTGSQLIALLRSDDPIKASVSMKGPVDLDILEGRSPDEVKGLLNGGLRILHEFDALDDDRTDVEVVLPPDLTFYGETPKGTTKEGRNLFDYEPGYRTISSVLAPSFGSELLGVDVVIDLSDVRSDYFLDVEVMASCDIEIDMSRILYGQEDLELNTSLEFELDYISSDMVRLLVSMGIIDKAAVERRLRSEISELLEPFIKAEDQEMNLTISDEELLFDGNYTSMDGDEPLRINAHVEGTSEPFGSSGSENDGGSIANVFVHRHWSPIVPFKTVKRSIVLEDAQKWDPRIKVIFPSGCGIKAWLVNGSERLEGGVEIGVEGAYPTVSIEGNGVIWDRLDLEVSMAGWFGFNNVLVCFATTIGALVILLLVLLVAVIRRVKRSLKKREERAGARSKDRPVSEDVQARQDFRSEGGSRTHQDRRQWPHR